MDVSSGGGIVIVNKIALSSYPYTLDFDSNTSVDIEVVPSFGYVFTGWSGDLSGTVNHLNLTIDCNKNIVANFSINMTLVGWTLGIFIIVSIFVASFIIRRRAIPAPQTSYIPHNDRN